MADQKVKHSIKIGKRRYKYAAGTPYLEIAKDFQDQFQDDIALVFVDGKLQELFKKVHKDCEISFVTTGDRVGADTYRRGAIFLMIKAIFDVGGHDKVKTVRVLHPVSNGVYCTLEGDVTVTKAFLNKVKKRMLEMADSEIPIVKRSIETNEAIAKFHDYGMTDKEELLQYRQSSRVNVYSINEFEDYFYGYMVPHTGYIRYFDLLPYDKGFALQLPHRESAKEVPKFQPQKKLFQVMQQNVRWGDMLDIQTVSDLNRRVVNGEINDLVLVQEALQEKRIGDIAEDIASRPNVKIVLIAGPSSSGKTSFSHRLSVQLRTLGLNPHPIACDNYFVERPDTPLDEDGKYDFEHIDAIDKKLLNRQINDMLAGKTVKLPTFNFETGQKEYLGNTLTLKDGDILVLEGIHCLNDELTSQIKKKNKYKVYISALTQLNIDEHNRIPTTDGRLIRRMIRDHRTRGKSPQGTIAMWPSVKRGEERNIFPYQEEADVMFNSALIYELAVLKQYAEPLLMSVPKDSPEYIEAKRLLKFFNYFVGFGSDNLPHNSLIREFIGGSCFNV